MPRTESDVLFSVYQVSQNSRKRNDDNESSGSFPEDPARDVRERTQDPRFDQSRELRVQQDSEVLQISSIQQTQPHKSAEGPV